MSRKNLIVQQRAHDDVSTEVERLSDAFALLCSGRRPDDLMILQYLRDENEELQSWAATNTSLGWATGIGTIEAARALANEPAGEGHLSYDDPLLTIEG